MAVPIFLQPLARYADFQGRSRPAEYWSFQLFALIVIGGLEAWMLYPLLDGKPFDPKMLLGHMLIAVPILLIVSFGAIIPALAVTVRRLHDVNLTGWLLVVPLALELVGQSMMYMFDSDAITHSMQGMTASLQQLGPSHITVPAILGAEWQMYRIMLPFMVPALLFDLALIVMFLWPGSKGDNRFGPNPRKA
jgi:uncharacterized membrane protein YhaH (DUF805 family)